MTTAPPNPGDDAPSTRRDVLPFRRSRKGAVPPPSRRRWVFGGAVTAIVVALLVLGTRTLGRFAGRGTGRAQRGAAGSVLVTATGARDSVRLPDGTRVILAPGSRLSVAPAYGQRERRVDMQGEAWFNVRRDASRPFVVAAGQALIRDLGTSFVVRTDGLPLQGGGVIVLVMDGRVSLARVSASDLITELSAGDRGELTEDRIAVYRGAVDTTDLAWTKGRLAYHDAPLAEVSADLQRWYGVRVRVTDSALATRRLTATFENEPADRVLESIAAAIGAEVERKGTDVLLRPAGARR